MIHAAAESTLAGVITAFGTWFVGIAAVIGAVALYRQQRSVKKVATATYHMVNGNLTHAKVSELAAMRLNLASLREVARLHEDAGRPVSAEANAVITAAAARIAELNSEIVGRRAQDDAGRARLADVQE